MKLSTKQVTFAFNLLNSARCQWLVELFAASVYGDVYNDEHLGRQKYLDKKFEEFQDNPLKFFYTLDLALQAGLIHNIKEQFAPLYA